MFNTLVSENGLRALIKYRIQFQSCNFRFVLEIFHKYICHEKSRKQQIKGNRKLEKIEHFHNFHSFFGQKITKVCISNFFTAICCNFGNLFKFLIKQETRLTVSKYQNENFHRNKNNKNKTLVQGQWVENKISLSILKLNGIKIYKQQKKNL